MNNNRLAERIFGAVEKISILHKQRHVLKNMRHRKPVVGMRRIRLRKSWIIFLQEKDKDGNFDYRARTSVAWDWEGCTYYLKPFR